jgi:8-oxo-dGTP pyrophosphatase MutT (NUDIX family)
VTGNFDLESLRKRLLPENSLLEAEKSEPPIAAVALVINPNDRGGSILLIKRAERKGDPWSGQMAFPGGHRSPADQTFLGTVIRETREEVGIRLQEHELLGMLPVVLTRGRRVRVAPFVFQLKQNVVVKTNVEVNESFWVPLNELQGIMPVRTIVHVEEGRLDVDAFIYRDCVIWGLTFRIINVLLNCGTDMDSSERLFFQKK